MTGVSRYSPARLVAEGGEDDSGRMLRMLWPSSAVGESEGSGRQRGLRLGRRRCRVLSECVYLGKCDKHVDECHKKLP